LDPSGESTSGTPSQWSIETSAQQASEKAAARAAEEAAARAAAEAAAKAAAERAAAVAAQDSEWASWWASYGSGPQWGGEEEWYEEEWEEEGGYEYASYQHGAKPEKEEGHLESGVLFRPLGEAAEEMGGSGGEGSGTSGLGTVPLCKAGVEGPCARGASEANQGHGQVRHRRRGSPSRCPGINCSPESAPNHNADEASSRHDIEKSVNEQFENGDTGSHEGNDDDGDASVPSEEVRVRG
jgi:hypothetical protein